MSRNSHGWASSTLSTHPADCMPLKFHVEVVDIIAAVALTPAIDQRLGHFNLGKRAGGL